MRVFVIAGEPSGDRLGAALMGGLRALNAEGVQFEGIGGEAMAGEGLESLFPMSELSVMGLAEILPKYRALKARIAQTAEAVIAARPDVLVTIDSPDFCLRVAKLVKARADIRIVHYVAPTVWAWRPKRAQKMARRVDQVLALFPFEPPLMEAAGVACDFVGHPVVAEPAPTDADGAAFRATYGIGDAPVLLVLPGSRRGEVARLAEPFGDGVRRFITDHPGWRVVIPAAGPVAGLVRDLTRDWPGDPILLDPGAGGDGDKRGAFAAAELALAASGTVSLELAAARTPMVIGYRFNWLTWQIVRAMIRIDTATLVNLVSDTRVVPECLGPECRGDLIARRLAEVAAAPRAQHEAMALTMERLGAGGEAPGLRAARAVLRGMGRQVAEAGAR